LQIRARHAAGAQHARHATVGPDLASARGCARSIEDQRR